MRPMCENLLREMITPECAAPTLELARRHGRTGLKAFCLDYMSTTWLLLLLGVALNNSNKLLTINNQSYYVY